MANKVMATRGRRVPWLLLGLGVLGALVVFGGVAHAEPGPAPGPTPGPAPAPTPSPAPAPIPAPSGGDYVLTTSKGAMTTSQAQGVLKVFGAWGVAHPDTDLSARSQMAGLAIDGVWGPQTALATKNYQIISGLTADGIIGPKTAVSLIADYTGITNGSGPVNS